MDGWSAPPVSPYGASRDELVADIKRLKQALASPELANSTLGLEFPPCFVQEPEFRLVCTNYEIDSSEMEQGFAIHEVVDGEIASSCFIPRARTKAQLEALLDRMSEVARSGEAIICPFES